jgi:hypothetical protein
MVNGTGEKNVSLKTESGIGTTESIPAEYKISLNKSTRLLSAFTSSNESGIRLLIPISEYASGASHFDSHPGIFISLRHAATQRTRNSTVVILFTT